MNKTGAFFKFFSFALLFCLIVLGGVYLFLKADTLSADNPELYIFIFALFLLVIWIIYIFSSQ